MVGSGRVRSVLSRATTHARAFFADDSGEILAAMAVGWAIGTFLLGAASTSAAVMNMEDTGKSATTMQLAAEAQRKKFEETPELQKKVSEEKKKELYARWDAMEKFSVQQNKKAFIDGMWAVGETAVDLSLGEANVQGKAKVLVEAAEQVLDAKTALYDVPGAIVDNNTNAAPEILEFTKDMTEQINGRKSAEDFLTPMRKTAAIHKIADMGADSAQIKIAPDGGAPQQDVRDRMADTISRSYADLKKRELKTAYMEQEDEGAYEEFMRRQVLGTHPRELEGAKSGDVFADKELSKLFDEGKTSVLLAMVQTENGPILVELVNEGNGRLTATSLATAEKITEVISEGEKTAEKPGEEKRADNEFAGTYSGDTNASIIGGGAQAFPTTMQVNDDNTFTLKVNYSGSGSGWRVKWMSGLKWTSTITGTVADDGSVTGKGTRTTTPIAADGNSPPPATSGVTMTGKIAGGTFTGSMVPESWQSKPLAVRLERQ
jgi:hypothetical protein